MNIMNKSTKIYVNEIENILPITTAKMPLLEKVVDGQLIFADKPLEVYTAKEKDKQD